MRPFKAMRRRITRAARLVGDSRADAPVQRAASGGQGQLLLALAAVVGTVLGTIALVQVNGALFRGDRIAFDGVNSTTLVTENSLTTSMLITDSVCPEELVHTANGVLPPTHQVQNLAGTGVTLTLPANLSDYQNKHFHLYSTASNVEHQIVLEEGGASWDKFNTYRFLRILSPIGSGVSFHVISENKLSLTGSNGALKCTGEEDTTCVPAENGAFTYAVVTPPGGVPEGAFTWPAPNGDPQTQPAAARNVPPAHQPYYPSPTLGGVFPPPDAVQFTSANAAIRALAGQTVYNTTIYFEPGVYPEAVIVDGFSSSHALGASFVSGGNDVAAPSGLTLIGDPRGFAGATYVDCAIETFSGDDFDINNPGYGNGELFGNDQINSVIGSGNQISLIACDTVSFLGLPNKTSCNTGTAVNFLFTGYGPGDKLLITDTSAAESYVLDVVAVSAAAISVNLTGSGISDLVSIFPTIPSASQCGSSVTFLPNRVIESPTLANEFNDHTNAAVLGLHVDVGVRGFWVKYASPSSLTSNGAVMLVSAAATVKNMVFDGRDINAEPYFGNEPVGIIHVTETGVLSDEITSAAYLETNDTETGARDIYRDVFPNSVVASDDSFSVTGVYSRGRVSLSQLVVVRSDMLIFGGEFLIYQTLTLSSASVQVLDIAKLSAENVYQIGSFFGVYRVASVKVTSMYALNTNHIVSMHSPTASADVDVVWLIDSVSGLVEDNGGGTVAIGASVGSVTGTDPLPGRYSPLRLFINQKPVFGTRLYSASGSMNTEYGNHAIINDSPTAITFSCSNAVNNRVYRIYSETAHAHTLSLSGCATAFAGLGVPATFGAASGNGLTFTVIDGRLIIENNINVT